ncbi:hypothetical protein [Hyalangium versicolor]|uniref:hypothetical protein n=1 Tax=Hyalangium versicolor TaxID=2861190 RepID=UPI001CCD3F9E|nr:hypothetical protein [Hyalangium versicolor]
MSTPVKFRIKNDTNGPRRLVLFQQDRSAEGGKPATGHLSFVLAVKPLAHGGYWDYQLPPGALQVAGMIQSETSGTSSTSNIEEAVYGDCWEIRQQPGEELDIKRSSSHGPEGAIQIVNLVEAGLGPRLATLHRGENPVLGFKLEPGNDVCFSLQLALYVAEVEAKDYAMGQVLRPQTIASALCIPYASFESVDVHMARIVSDATGKHSLEIKRTLREELRAPQTLEEA